LDSVYKKKTRGKKIHVLVSDIVDFITAREIVFLATVCLFYWNKEISISAGNSRASSGFKGVHSLYVLISCRFV